MNEQITIWFFLIMMLINSILDIFVGLLRTEREQALKQNYDNFDIVKGIFWTICIIILIML